jgi:hypothetical protein
MLNRALGRELWRARPNSFHRHKRSPSSTPAIRVLGPQSRAQGTLYLKLSSLCSEFFGEGLNQGNLWVVTKASDGMDYFGAVWGAA